MPETQDERFPLLPEPGQDITADNSPAAGKMNEPDIPGAQPTNNSPQHVRLKDRLDRPHRNGAPMQLLAGSGNLRLPGVRVLKLQDIEAFIGAILINKFGVASLFHDPAPIDNIDQIGIDDRR